MTNICTARVSSKRVLLGAGLALLLVGCTNDSASYIIDGSDEHTITLLRAQNGFWTESAKLTIVATRLPDCRGGLDLQDIPLSVTPELYQAPADYAQPIYILRVGARHFAVSTAQCKVQEFKETPANLGTRLGTYQPDAEGRLVFKQS